jgi:hypothetical protein
MSREQNENPEPAKLIKNINFVIETPGLDNVKQSSHKSRFG